MRIYLIGYMGSGKSSVGKKLAARMGFSFIDIDQHIEMEQNLRISELFKQKGEAVFRQLEHKAILETFSHDNCVVSTGGGAPVFFDNMKQMQKFGLTIYLKAEAAVLASRLQTSLFSRPLLADLKSEELVDFMQNQINERAAFYEQAHLHIEAKDLTPALLHERILLWLSTA
ncbi:MAG TPA: shikimate kinase [Bacteroidales bacterium]|nr:shikimate kinase [Bacteroidales bacterium]